MSVQPFFSPIESQIVDWTRIASGSLSLLGSILLLLLAVKRIWSQCSRRKRPDDASSTDSMTGVLPMITILSLALSDVLSAITLIVQGASIGQGWTCKLAGFAAQAIQPMPFLWYSGICYSLFRVWHVIKKKESEAQVQSFLQWHLRGYVFICWVFPLLVALAMLFFPDVYGPTGEGGSCWFVPRAFIARTVFFYAPVLTVFCINTMVFAWNWRENIREDHWEDLVYYTGSFCIIWGVSMLSTAVYWIAGRPVFVFSELSAATFPLQGVVNFVFWGIIMERRRIANESDESQQVLLSNRTHQVSEISFFHQRTFTWREPQHRSGRFERVEPT